MALLWILLVISTCLNCCWANEPYCRQYEYDEKMLSKMIRTEIAMETLTKKLESMETSLEKRVTNIEKQNAEDSVEAASIDGGWTDWSDWTGCTSSCDGGIQSRYRSCDKPARYLNGKTCDGPPTEYRACSGQPCDGERSLAAGGKTIQRIGFTVRYPSNSPKNGALQFSMVLTNYGDDFNQATGRFVCEVPGLYLFTATIIRNSNTGVRCYCHLVVNNSNMIFVVAHTRHTGDYPSGSGSLVHELKAGDEVYLGDCANVDKIVSTTHFSGVLIM